MVRIDIDTLRRTPAYPFAEAAHYLNMPTSTLRAWCLGQTYSYKNEAKLYKSVIRLDGNRADGLSFLNLVEAHVLAAIRRRHNIPLPKVRAALEFVSESLGVERPLLDASFQTDGVHLFVDHMEQLLNVSRSGQLVIDAFREHLQRIERDPTGVPIKLYPFTRTTITADAPAPVEINPCVAFGRPVLRKRAVPTAVLADRFKAGDSLQELAADYDTSTADIEEAIRCELDRRQAA